MALTAGTRLGHYDVTSLLGSSHRRWRTAANATAIVRHSREIETAIYDVPHESSSISCSRRPHPRAPTRGDLVSRVRDLRRAAREFVDLVFSASLAFEIYDVRDECSSISCSHVDARPCPDPRLTVDGRGRRAPDLETVARDVVRSAPRGPEGSRQETKATARDRVGRREFNESTISTHCSARRNDHARGRDTSLGSRQERARQIEFGRVTARASGGTITRGARDTWPVRAGSITRDRGGAPRRVLPQRKRPSAP